jgi:hypothetical protein
MIWWILGTIALLALAWIVPSLILGYVLGGVFGSICGKSSGE